MRVINQGDYYVKCKIVEQDFKAKNGRARCRISIENHYIYVYTDIIKTNKEFNKEL